MPYWLSQVSCCIWISKFISHLYTNLFHICNYGSAFTSIYFSPLTFYFWVFIWSSLFIHGCFKKSYFITIFSILEANWLQLVKLFLIFFESRMKVISSQSKAFDKLLDSNLGIFYAWFSPLFFFSFFLLFEQ